MKVTRLNNFFGAEIQGIDAANPTDDNIEEIKQLWLTHKVLVLRNQVLTPEEHVDFSRNFGDLEVHPFGTIHPEHPEVLVLESGGNTGKQAYSATDWHSDVTYREKPPMGSILRGKTIPPVGGDTCFSDATEAYSRLDPEIQSMVEELSAVHDWSIMTGKGKNPLRDDTLDEMRKIFPLMSHPVIRTHPETSAKAIFTNNFFTSHIEGVDGEESQYLLRKLAGAIRDPSIQIRVRWDETTVVMWDNRCVQHAGTDDFLPAHRRMERTTVAGDRPF